MDKNEYETYEYLPTTYVNEADASQLLVVQEDGTLLCFDRPVQYVTQEGDAKSALEGVQGCDTYDVAQQQLYIDGDDSSELISVHDKFTSDGDSNVYAKNYLLQDDKNAIEVPMEQDEDVHYKKVPVNEESIDDTDADGATDQNAGDCTEITLNDEQYQLLEQKGWILLESSDNTFLLDSSGLHDITADEKLILKLKCELQEDDEEENESSFKKEKVQNKSIEIKQEDTQSDVENIVQGNNIVNYVIENEGIMDEEEMQENTVFTTNKPETETVTEEIIEEEYSDQADISPFKAEHDYVKLTSVKDSYAKKQKNTIKIKTKYSFKDIPPEIVLGKFNGKKLIARVVNTVRPVRQLGASVQASQVPRLNQPGFAGLDDGKFENLIREAVRGSVECGVKDVTAAEIVVGQLSRVPAFRPAVMERGLIITKVIVQEQDTGELYSESNPSLVTGRAVGERDSYTCRFQFIPEMLRKLAYTEEYQNTEGDESDHYDFLHIHIRETKSTDGIIRISITLNKRYIPLNLLIDNTASHPHTIYACSSCAGVYSTAEGLQIHQETECLAIKTENTSTDAEESKNAYKIINTSRGKQYACNLCNIVYTKLVNCQEHIKTHFKTDSVSGSGKSSQVIVKRLENKKVTKTPADAQKGLYRCKMCNCAFLDASSLSKHIVTRHIDVN